MFAILQTFRRAVAETLATPGQIRFHGRIVDRLSRLLREFRQHYHTTGAIAPSGRPLAAALARFVTGHEQPPHPHGTAARGPAAHITPAFWRSDREPGQSPRRWSAALARKIRSIWSS